MAGATVPGVPPRGPSVDRRRLLRLARVPVRVALRHSAQHRATDSTDKVHGQHAAIPPKPLAGWTRGRDFADDCAATDALFRAAGRTKVTAA
jgi:hypothetical protein